MKTIKVDECGECPFYLSYSSVKGGLKEFCTQDDEERDVLPHTTPEWCPLLKEDGIKVERQPAF